MKPSWVWEISFECGNKVGGIWTVITSKAGKMKKIFGERYFAVGFYNPKRVEMLHENPPEWLSKIFEKLSKYGLKFYYGKWIEGANSNLILIDSKEFERKFVNEIKTKFWEIYRIDSLFAPYDYNEPLAWSYAAGMFIEEAAKVTPGLDIAHFHEWLAGGGLLYLKMKKVQVPTVFTTHATVLGRAASSAGVTIFEPDVQAKQLGVLAKHLTEKASAHNAEVFTTVSELTAEEAEKVLGRKVDIVTYNALDDSRIPDLAELLKKKVKLRNKVEEFIKAYFLPYYSLDLSDYTVIYTAGRYEFTNKGFDLFIKALGDLNNRLKKENGKTTFAFILVPTGTLGIKDEVIQNFVVYKRMKEMLLEDIGKMTEKIVRIMQDEEYAKEHLSEIILDLKQLGMRFMSRRGKNPPLSAFQLSYSEEDDQIIRALKENGLLNREEDRVKVIFYPVYLNRQDELLGMSYLDFVTASSMGVFLSRYEPWGYTALESAAHLSVAITTSNTGFGRAVMARKGGKGIYVIDAKKDIVKQASDIMFNFVNKPKDSRLDLEMSASRFARIFTWKRMISRYIKAYEIAVNRMIRKIASLSQ